MKNDYLPIGSIVTVNGKKMMIIGYDQNVVSDNLTTSDYLGCEYPYGLLNITSLSVFNQSDITNVDFQGFISEQYNDLLQKLGKTIAKAASSPASQSIYQFDKDGFVISDLSVKEEPKEAPKKRKSTFKFDENGVVISEDFVEELMPTDVAPNQYLFDAEKDAQADVVKDNTVLTIENNKDVNYLGGYTFDDNGTVLSDNTVKKEEAYSARSNNQFQFDENGFVIAEETYKPQFAFDENGFVIGEA